MEYSRAGLSAYDAQGGRGRPGRRPMLTHDSIIDMAIETGFDRITIVEMAQRLGVKHSTLYRYFDTRDDLVLAAADRVYSNVTWPTAGPDWRTYLTDTALVAWRLYSAHPGLVETMMALPTLPESVARNFNRVAVDLLGLGFEPVDAVGVVDVVMELTTEMFLMGRKLTVGEPVADSSVREQQVRSAVHLADDRLRDIIVRAIKNPPEEWFRHKLSLLFDGVASRVRPRT